jgi:hypothetical protein
MRILSETRAARRPQNPGLYPPGRRTILSSLLLTAFALAGCSNSAKSSPPGDAAAPRGGDCSMLGAEGEWQNITPPQISLDPKLKIPNGFNQFGVGSFVIDPLDSRTIYIGSCEQGIYKSTDCGASWVHINTGRNGKTLQDGMQWTMAIDPVDSQVLYTNAGYNGAGTLFKSINGGVDWDPAFTPDLLQHFQFGGFVGGIRIDPADHRHLLVSMHENCTNGAAPGCVVESKDAGTSWHTIDGIWGQWGEGGTVDILDSQTWLYSVPFTQPAGVYLTTNAGMSWKHVSDSTAMPGVVRGSDGSLVLTAKLN